MTLLTCPSAATCRSFSSMSAFACCTAAKALLASAATSTMPAPSSSRARWISSYLCGQNAVVTQGPLVPRRMEMAAWELASDTDVGGKDGGKGLKHPQHGAPWLAALQHCGAMSLMGLSHVPVGQVPNHRDQVL